MLRLGPAFPPWAATLRTGDWKAGTGPVSPVGEFTTRTTTWGFSYSYVGNTVLANLFLGFLMFPLPVPNPAKGGPPQLRVNGIWGSICFTDDDTRAAVHTVAVGSYLTRMNQSASRWFVSDPLNPSCVASTEWLSLTKRVWDSSTIEGPGIPAELCIPLDIPLNIQLVPGTAIMVAVSAFIMPKCGLTITPWFRAHATQIA